MIMKVSSAENGDGAVLARDFGFKLKLAEPTEIDRLQRTPEEEEEEEEEEELKKEAGVAAEEDEEEEEEEGEEEGAKEEEEEDFSFACANPDGSPVSAEDVFQNGQIRPIFPLFDRSLLFDDAPGDSESNKESTNDSSTALRQPLRKLFVEEKDNGSSSSEQEEQEPEGPFCEWNARKAVDASPEVCKKSNSTGFSKLWRFRERVLRSNSDGKDAFVFLNHHNLPPPPQPASTTTATSAGKKSEIKSSDEVRAEKKEKKVAVVNKGQIKKNKKPETSSLSAYLKNRKLTTEEDKRRSYLPYRQEVVGFFTNVNGLSRNVHPF